MTMDNGYKLTYFNARGLTEPIRFIFAYAKVNYEDIRTPFVYKDGVPVIPQVLPSEIKAKCQWAQVPLLEYENGRKLNQSITIARFLAKRFNLTGADEYEAAKCDEYVDTIFEFFKEFLPIFSELDKTKKIEKAKKLEEIMGPKWFGKFEKIVAANEGKYLVGRQTTWADLYFAAVVNSGLIHSKIDFLSTYPTLKAYLNSVLSIPQIKAYIEKRPETEF